MVDLGGDNHLRLELPLGDPLEQRLRAKLTYAGVQGS